MLRCDRARRSDFTQICGRADAEDGLAERLRLFRAGSPKADEPNRVWVSDITCFKVDGKYLYVCLILDLFSQKVDAHRGSVQEQYLSHHFHLPSGISEQKRVPAADVFSDQGSQYTSNAFRKLLRMNKVVQSFSESGRPHSTLNYKTPNGFELRHAQR